jgi:hypothetical protein
MPDTLFAILSCDTTININSENSFENVPPQGHAYNKDSMHLLGEDDTLCGGVAGGCINTYQNVSSVSVSFEKGGRDDTLFHLANYLVKGGMPEVTIRQYLSFFGKHCIPPFDESELKLKIKSAFDRNKKRNVGLKDELLELINVSSGIINVSMAYQSVSSVSKNEKAAVRNVFKRFVDDGLLEKSNTKAGEYRIIDKSCHAENWKDAIVENIKLWLPFELNEMIEIPAGSILLFAGAQDAGKSCVMMNIAKENMKKWNTHYFSSELSAASFKNRLSKFDNMHLEDWNINFYSRGSNFSDVIKCGENDLNIIDYLEIHDQFYKIAGYLDEIYKKMAGKGVTVVAIQKDPYKEFGRGGSFIEEKPVLSITLDRGGIAKINKFKGEWWGENPRGKQYQYKIINGSRLKMVRHWHEPAPK